MTCWNDSNYIAKAFQNPKIEFILAQHPWIENDCQFADIILPVTTKFETRRHRRGQLHRRVRHAVPGREVHRAAGRVQERLRERCAPSPRSWACWRSTPGASRWTSGSGSASTPPASHDLVTWEEFKEKGHYVIPNDPDWEKHEIGAAGLRRRPGEQSAHHPHRQAGVLLAASGRPLPRRQGTAAGARTGWSGAPAMTRGSPATGPRCIPTSASPTIRAGACTPSTTTCSG